MQRIEQIDSPKEKILKNYVEPFIASIASLREKTKLDEVAFIQEIFCCLQMNVADSYHYFSMTDQQQKFKFLYDFDNAIMRKSFKLKLILHPELKEKFIKLGMLYLEEDKQKQEFPGMDSAEIQTCIRELFYDYLNPLPEMKIKNSNTRLSFNQNQALEYTCFLQHGGSLLDSEKDGFIPSIWAVNVPNVDHLSFTQDKIILNEHASCSAYDGNRRDASFSYAMTTSDAVQPLLGTVIVSFSDFASYKTFNRVNMPGCQNEQETSSRKICSIQ